MNQTDTEITSKDSRTQITDGVTGSKKKCFKLTYEDIFYRPRSEKRKTAPNQEIGFPLTNASWCQSDLKARILKKGGRYGFPGIGAIWCNGELKMPPLRLSSNRQRKLVSVIPQKTVFSSSPDEGGINTYLGIAADEPERIARHEKKPGIVLPLVLAGWTEADCRKWCEDNDLLSPIYTTASRGGCWFCHNQGVNQLRLLRKNYPDLWELLLKWDTDSPVTFHADGHTVHDFDERFRLEDEGFYKADDRFRWEFLEYQQMNINQFLKRG